MALLPNAPLVQVAEILVEVLHLSESTTSPEMRAWCNSVFAHACRQLECFVVPEVSVLADEKSRQLRCGDLAEKRWGFQACETVDGEAVKLFHWEHVLPVAELRRRINRLGPARTVQAVAKELRAADIAWVLKSENDKLDRAGFRHERDGDPWEAYRLLGIRMRGQQW
jgi:hypothetical protein